MGWRELHHLCPWHRPCAGTGTPGANAVLDTGAGAMLLLVLRDQILKDFGECQNSPCQAEILPVSSAGPHAVSPAELRARSYRPVPAPARSPVSGAVLSHLG